MPRSEWRQAVLADAVALTDLERDANLVALAHVFPPDRYPFPYDDVRERWLQRFADGVTVEVVDGPGRLDAFVAHDGETLRHLAVHPERWRTGLGRAGVERAVAAGSRRLWCVVDNRAARALYEGLGWRPTGREHAGEWPPHPLEIEYVATEPDGALTASEG